MFRFTALVTCLAILFYFLTSVRVAKARATFGIKAASSPRVMRNFKSAALVWIAGRILYMIGYSTAANKRGRGFAIQASATIFLWLGAVGGIAWRLVHA
jgi:glutathione S-transferase